jgi:hypothetical protein
VRVRSFVQPTRGTLLVGFAFTVLAGYAGCAKAPPQKPLIVAVAPGSPKNDAPWKEPEERVDVIGAPHITLDMDAPNAHSPFSIRWENLPAVSEDGKTIAAMVDAGTIFARPRLEIIDAATGARMQTIDFLDGPNADRWRGGDAPEGFAKEVVAEAEEDIRKAHELTASFTPLPRTKLDVTSLYDERGKSLATSTPFVLAQDASIGSFRFTLEEDKLTLLRDETKIVQKTTNTWRRPTPIVPGRSLPCESKPVASEVAVDEARGRAVVIVHHLNLSPGDICAEPEELRLVTWRS